MITLEQTPAMPLRLTEDGTIRIADSRVSLESIAGVFVVPRSLPLRQAIEDLELMITCSANEEWVNIIRYLPF